MLMKCGMDTDYSRSMQVFTDKPANCLRLPDGHIDFDAPCNVVVRRTATRLAMPPAECRLAIRCAYGGSRRFDTRDGCHMVDDGGYLILNLGQTVSSELESSRPVECFNVTFQPEFAERVLSGIVEPIDRLLDEPKHASRQPVQFFEKRYAHDTTVSPVLDRIRHCVADERVTPGWLEERLHDLLVRMLQAHRGVAREIDSVPALRKSTRVELYRRLTIARDYIEANSTRTITLDDMADSACLSPHHFLRLFRDAFGATPHQYLTGRRLDHAKSLLSTTGIPVTDVCITVGFESLGSFSWLFRQRFNLSPSQYRRQFTTPSLPGGPCATGRIGSA